VKVNAKFPAATPALRGVVCLFDSGSGQVLALTDAAGVTGWRKGLAAAVATHRRRRAPGRSSWRPDLLRGARMGRRRSGAGHEVGALSQAERKVVARTDTVADVLSAGAGTLEGGAGQPLRARGLSLAGPGVDVAPVSTMPCRDDNLIDLLS
jgi:hypothetical protein